MAFINPSYITVAITGSSSAPLSPLLVYSETSNIEIALVVYKPTPFDIVFASNTVLPTQGIAVANPLA